MSWLQTPFPSLMRFLRSYPKAARFALAGAACSAVALAAPLVAAQDERLLEERDLRKVTGALGEWLTALNEGEDTLEPESDFREELQKINEKKLKGETDLLSSPADLGAILYGANDYPRKRVKGAGKVTMKSADRGGRTIEYAVWAPSKYKAKSGPYPLIISIPEEGENPEAHITNHWTNNELREGTIIVSPKMPGDSKLWTQTEGLGAILLSLRFALDEWAIDVERTFIGGRARGGEVAIEVANMFPARFAGAFAWAADAGKGIEAENVQHVPILITGGGSHATDLEKRAKEATLENVTLDPDGGLDAIVAWMAEKTRVNYPTKVTVIQGERFPSKAYWIQFAPVAKAGVRVDAEIDKETNTITIKSEEITEVSLFLSDALVDLSKPVTVIANGAETVDTFERSVSTFLEFIDTGKIDPARIFVATKQYDLPSVAESDG